MYKRLKLMFYNSYNLISFNTYFLLIGLDKPTKRFDLFDILILECQLSQFTQLNFEVSRLKYF